MFNKVGILLCMWFWEKKYKVGRYDVFIYMWFFLNIIYYFKIFFMLCV